MHLQQYTESQHNVYSQLSKLVKLKLPLNSICLKITRGLKTQKYFWGICQSSSAGPRHPNTFHHSEQRTASIPTLLVLLGNLPQASLRWIVTINHTGLGSSSIPGLLGQRFLSGKCFRVRVKITFIVPAIHFNEAEH